MCKENPPPTRMGLFRLIFTDSGSLTRLIGKSPQNDAILFKKIFSFRMSRWFTCKFGIKTQQHWKFSPEQKHVDRSLKSFHLWASLPKHFRKIDFGIT